MDGVLGSLGGRAVGYGLGYAVAVGPAIVAATVAVWRPTMRQCVAMIAWGSVGIIPPLVWWPGFPVLLIAPLIPWRRTWARFVVPACVIGSCGALIAMWHGSIVGRYLWGFPMLIAIASIMTSLLGSVRGRWAMM